MSCRSACLFAVLPVPFHGSSSMVGLPSIVHVCLLHLRRVRHCAFGCARDALHICRTRTFTRTHTCAFAAVATYQFCTAATPVPACCHAVAVFILPTGSFFSRRLFHICTPYLYLPPHPFFHLPIFLPRLLFLYFPISLPYFPFAATRLFLYLPIPIPSIPPSYILHFFLFLISSFFHLSIQDIFSHSFSTRTCTPHPPAPPFAPPAPPLPHPAFCTTPPHLPRTFPPHCTRTLLPLHTALHLHGWLWMSHHLPHARTAARRAAWRAWRRQQRHGGAARCGGARRARRALGGLALGVCGRIGGDGGAARGRAGRRRRRCACRFPRLATATARVPARAVAYHAYLRRLARACRARRFTTRRRFTRLSRAAALCHHARLHAHALRCCLAHFAATHRPGWLRARARTARARAHFAAHRTATRAPHRTRRRKGVPPPATTYRRRALCRFRHAARCRVPVATFAVRFCRTAFLLRALPHRLPGPGCSAAAYLPPLPPRACFSSSFTNLYLPLPRGTVACCRSPTPGSFYVYRAFTFTFCRFPTRTLPGSFICLLRAHAHTLPFTVTRSQLRAFAFCAFRAPLPLRARCYTTCRLHLRHAHAHTFTYPPLPIPYPTCPRFVPFPTAAYLPFVALPRSRTAARFAHALRAFAARGCAHAHTFTGSALHARAFTAHVFVCGICRFARFTHLCYPTAFPFCAPFAFCLYRTHSSHTFTYLPGSSRAGLVHRSHTFTLFLAFYAFCRAFAACLCSRAAFCARFYLPHLHFSHFTLLHTHTARILPFPRLPLPRVTAFARLCLFPTPATFPPRTVPACRAAPPHRTRTWPTATCPAHAAPPRCTLHIPPPAAYFTPPATHLLHRRFYLPPTTTALPRGFVAARLHILHQLVKFGLSSVRSLIGSFHGSIVPFGSMVLSSTYPARSPSPYLVVGSPS